MSQQREQWGSRWGFIAAAMGMAIGTGNIWRFPREVGENGGGPFLIAWTVALLIWAIPILMGEMVMGRKTGLGTIGAFRDFVGKKYTWMGTWIAAVCLGIMFYYSVIMGWCVKYFTLALSGTFKAGITIESTQAVWDTFTTTPSQTILFHFISMLVAGIIIYKGVKDGIEKACKIMIPTLFALLILSAIRATTLPGAAKGLEFLFSPKLYMLKEPKIWLAAFTQAGWSTGAGWGFIITYAVYTKKKEDVAGNCMLMGVSDNVGALVAGLTVLPAVFALSPSLEFANQVAATGGTGLTFVYLAQLFSTLPGGNIIAAIFFLAMALAALSSLLPMIEVGVRNIMDAGVTRQKASLIVLIVGFFAGIPSAYSLDFNNNQDWVWGMGLFISGLFFMFALLKFGVERIRTKYINTEWSDFYVGKWFNMCIKVAPVITVVVIIWWVKQALTWDGAWDIFGVYSVGTILFQFAILLGLAFLTNNWLANKIGKGYDVTEINEDEIEGEA